MGTIEVPGYEDGWLPDNDSGPTAWVAVADPDDREPGVTALWVRYASDAGKHATELPGFVRLDDDAVRDLITALQARVGG